MIIAVVALVATIAALLTDRHLERRARTDERAAWANERQHLVNAVVARHPADLAALDRANQPRPEREDQPARPRPIGM